MEARHKRSIGEAFSKGNPVTIDLAAILSYNIPVTEFRWNEWNIEHATKHSCTIEEIESVVRREFRARRLRKAAAKKWQVVGRGIGDRLIEVVFLIDDDRTTIYVIHAMPLTTRRRRRSR